MKLFNKFLKNLPSLLTALVFAIVVWIVAVTQADPTEVLAYPRPVPLELIGQDNDLMIVDDIPNQVSLTLRAPSTILEQLVSDSSLIEVTLDLSGLGAGLHTISPQVNIALEPVEVVRISPATIITKLEPIVTQDFPITVRTTGSPAIGFELKTPELSTEIARISGAQYLISAIDQVVAEVNVDLASENIQSEVSLVAYDNKEQILEGALISPSSVDVFIEVVQRGGYRTVGIIPVTDGNPAEGYRLLNIFSVPPTVTVYASDENLIDSLSSSIETDPININSAEETLSVRVSLNLPEGVNVVGSQFVTIQIEIEPIISSEEFKDIPVVIEGLTEGLEAEISPDNIDVILEGPVALLNSLDEADILVVLDLEGLEEGTQLLTPEVRLAVEGLTVESINPKTVEVVIK
jgi:YbbR domain-containing protein